jgi:hypothetical protein
MTDKSPQEERKRKKAGRNIIRQKTSGKPKGSPFLNYSIGFFSD